MGKHGKYWRLFTVAGAGTALALLPVTQADAGMAQSSVVKVVPKAGTPNLKTGTAVRDQAVANGIVYSGGLFSQFENGARTTTYNRQNFVAWSATTGAVQALAPSFDNSVEAIVPNATGSALYVAGTFRHVNGLLTGSVVRINLSTGKLDTAFKWPLGGSTYSLQFANNRLYAAGTFGKRVAALNPLTGADTGTVAITVAGQLEPTIATKVAKIAIDPTGTDLVAIGNFTTVNNQSRRGTFRLTLPATGAATLKDWHPTRFDVTCRVKNSPRDVDWSPDGSYFVIVASGAPSGGYPAFGFCDAAGRWERSSTGQVAEPTWINWTGGDSIYSVAVSGAAVYVGGHMRYLDNPLGFNSAGPGAFQVDSVGAIDPTTGLAIRTWNADYMDRGHGKEDLTLYSGGLLVGGDGTYLHGIYHRGLGIFPLP
jgi:hypothetical protein